MIVVDSSALVDLGFGVQGRAGRVAAALEDADWDLAAPHLVDIEIVSAVRRLTLARVVDDEAADIRLSSVQSLPVRRYPHVRLLPRIWELRTRVTAADAAYVALAEALDAPLLTTDRRLARSHGHTATIIAA
jgi:predicted nucleic acid-binding protein